MKYSKEKFEWLIVAIIGLTFMILSSQETWGNCNANSFYFNVNDATYFTLIALFLATLILVHYFDVKKISQKNRIIFVVTFSSILFDLLVLLATAFFVLFSINQISTDILKSLRGILFLTLPWALGAIALSSLTTDQLYKRTKNLQKEIDLLKERTSELQADKEEREERLEDLQKQFADFKNRRPK